MKTSTLVLASLLALSGITGCATDLQGPDAPDTDAGMTQPDSGPQGPVCGDGVCSGNADCYADCRDVTPRCLAGGAVCDGVCRDLQNNTAHCGVCNRACASGQTCNSGVCTSPVTPPPADAGLPACQTGSARCSDGLCHSIETEVANCGACGHACAAGQVCSASACTTPVVDAGTPTSGEDTWVITYTTSGGDNASEIHNWNFQPIYTHCDVNRTDLNRTGPLTISRCEFRIPRSDTREVWFNAQFILAANPPSQPYERSTWAAYEQSPGVPNSYGTITGTKNGVPVRFRMTRNAMGNGYNWTPVL